MRSIVSRKYGFQQVLIPKCATRTFLDYFKNPIYEAKESRYKKRNLFEFAFVRNPYDRLLSAYYDKVTRKRNEHLIMKYGLNYNDSFERFIDIALQTDDEHWRPQSYYVKRGTFLGTVENIKSDFGVISDILKMPVFELSHRNISKKTDLWTPELKNKVKVKYYEDLMLWDVLNRGTPKL